MDKALATQELRPAGARAAWNRVADLVSRAIGDSLLALGARLSLAAIFFSSGRTKVEGLITVTEGTQALFRDEYKVPLLAPEVAAHLATWAEHLLPALLVLGLFTRGSALALLALTLNTHLLLVLICGINVMEAGSVAIQMGVFKASGRTRRLFRMSPIHHHFELVGWPETTVIIRFWLISAICVASALAIFIADFTRQVAGS